MKVITFEAQKSIITMSITNICYVQEDGDTYYISTLNGSTFRTSKEAGEAIKSQMIKYYTSKEKLTNIEIANFS